MPIIFINTAILKFESVISISAVNLEAPTLKD
jgi:hypothetical protein